MKKLVLFDLDGTLVESNAFDRVCYVEAVKRALGVERVDEEWSHYRNVTDRGVLAEIYQRQFGREISAEVEETVKQTFLAVMEAKLREPGAGLRPLAGAQAALDWLSRSGEWSAAMATGAWRESAELKLREAGLRAGHLAWFTCNDAVARIEIMGRAVREMTRRAGGAFGRVVYVGDAEWDVQASREMGVAFLGVGDERAKLLAAGAGHALPDYTDLQKFQEAIEDCRVPASAKS